MEEFIHKYFTELVAIVSITVWLLRIEQKVLHVEKLTDTHSELFKKLSEIAERLSHIEGKLGSHRD